MKLAKMFYNLKGKQLLDVQFCSPLTSINATWFKAGHMSQTGKAVKHLTAIH